MTTEKKSHRGEQVMFPLVEQWLQGNQAQKQFCSEHELSVAVFQYWLRKYRQQSNSAHAEGFIPLKLQDATAASGVEIIYADGTKVRFGAEARFDQIRQMVPVFVQR